MIKKNSQKAFQTSGSTRPTAVFRSLPPATVARIGWRNQREMSAQHTFSYSQILNMNVIYLSLYL
jgi:hypothetical protein